MLGQRWWYAPCWSKSWRLAMQYRSIGTWPSWQHWESSGPLLITQKISKLDWEEALKSVDEVSLRPRLSIHVLHHIFLSFILLSRFGCTFIVRNPGLLSGIQSNHKGFTGLSQTRIKSSNLVKSDSSHSIEEKKHRNQVGIQRESRAFEFDEMKSVTMRQAELTNLFIGKPTKKSRSLAKSKNTSAPIGHRGAVEKWSKCLHRAFLLCCFSFLENRASCLSIKSITVW